MPLQYTSHCSIPYKVLNVIACYCPLFPSVQRTLCHSEKLLSNDVRISRKGHLVAFGSDMPSA